MTVGQGEQGTLELRLFGTFDVRLKGQPLPPLRYRKEQWLLALLVLRQDRDVPRDWLAATLWPDNEERQGLFYLRKALSNLRNALGEEASRLLSPTSRAVRLNLSGAFADVLAFDAAVSRSLAEAGQEERLQQAVNLYRGPLLQDCPEEWASAEREFRAQSYLTALETLANLTAARGEPAAAVRWLRLALSSDPYRESAARALMEALADSGDRAAVAQVYRDLRETLRRELNADPAPETEALYRALSQRELQTAAPPPVAPLETASRRHLPVPLSDLIGREQEVVEVTGWLSRRRLVTLLGPGGVGKTRLSIAGAEAALPQFPSGVWFVDLAALTDSALIPQAVAKALHLGEETRLSYEETLTDALASRSLLLVLDNCEHVLDACAALVYSLLSACPELRILTTSRQALAVTGEQVYPVPALSFPSESVVGPQADTAQQEKDPATLLEYEAVRLFVERATQANPLFRLNRRTAEAVVAVCRRLDGIPLAIEMAAARLRSLSVQEVETRLADRFRLLTSGNRAALPRQQTLRAAIDWSYDLLSEAERTLLCRLSVFSGGWTLEGAEALVRDEGGGMRDESDFLLHPSSLIPHPFEVLSSLVEKSLAVCEESEDEPRYRMLETARQYGWERLAESGEATGVRRRHRDYCLRLAQIGHERLIGPEAGFWIARLEREHDNLRAALDFCLEDSDSVETGLRIAGALARFWGARGYFSEGRKRCAALLSHPGAQTPTKDRAATLLGSASLAHYHHHHEEAYALTEAALTISQALNDPVGMVRAKSMLIEKLLALDDGFRKAQEAASESLAFWRERGDRQEVAAALHSLGLLARDSGDLMRARSLIEESLALYRALDDKRGIAAALHTVAYMDYCREDFRSALALTEEALRLNREVGNRLWELYNLALLEWTSLSLGNEEATRSYCETSLRLLQELGIKPHIAGALECLADLAHLQQRWERAACLWGSAEVLRDACGIPMDGGSIQTRHDRTVAVTREALGDAAFAIAWNRGRSLTMEQAIERAHHDR